MRQNVGDGVQSLGYHTALSSPLTYRSSLGKQAEFCLLSYMSSSHHSVSQPRQRSQSTPNVGILRTEQRPRRTKTSIDFFAAPPQNPTHRESRVDPFNLAGFFPSAIRRSDQEPFGWWRDDDPVDESEELASELEMLHGDSGSLSSQHVLFSREDNPAEAVTKGEDKPGALTIRAHFHFIPLSTVITVSGCSDWGKARLGGWARARGGVPAFALCQ
jgi:hypothetical protein